jgi:glyoxylase-like metal-dependent hydrolase (beta-lactamase superfamily II)/rhodanese-related sulfurtransferase
MYFEQFYLGCLAHASYMLASDGEAVVVDPQRDVDIYLKAAEEQGVRIRHIFETHLHADFVSGHRELAERTGATIYIGPHGGARFSRVEVQDGFQLRVGKIRIQVLSTPGHTPESICLVVTDEEKSAKPWAVLTGDTLFIGDVGRPDLSESHTPAELAGMLFDSLHNKLLKLPDDVLVYPAHGAGSLCGRNMRAERSSTIATERLTNYALQIPSRAEFVRELTSKLPARPEYFSHDAEINRDGASALSELPELTPIQPQELQALLDAGVTALDVRPGDAFAFGHVPGSINIALSGQFASWAGSVLGLSSRPVLIAETAEQISEARLRLARVGIEDARGYLQGGFAAWKQADLPVAQFQQISVETLRDWLQAGHAGLLDVRREGEWKTAHIQGASWSPLDTLARSLPQMDRNARIAVHCKSGYRSAIACSVLQRAGFRDVANVVGGFDAWQAANLPFVTEQPIEV